MITRPTGIANVLAFALLIVQANVVWAQRASDQRPGMAQASTTDERSDSAVAKSSGAVDLASIEQRTQALYRKVAPAVVRLTYGKDPERPFGSGVIVTPDGHVVLSSGYTRSIVRDELLTIHLTDGRRVHGQALGWSGEWTLGVLKITEEGPWPYVDLSEQADVKAGELCVAMGHPEFEGRDFDRQPALQLGTVTKSAPTWLTSNCVMLAHGYSVFDLEGRLVGVTAGVGEDARHTSAEVLRTHWKDLIDGKNLDRVRLQSPDTDGGETTAPRRGEPGDEKERVAAAIEKGTSASVRIVDLAASGVIVTADGYVITCGHHFGLPGRRVTVALSDGRDASAFVLGANPISDVGLLKITGEGPWPHVELGSSIKKPGDPCILIGYPTARAGRQPWILETKVIRPTDTLPSKDDWSASFWTAEDPREIGGASGGGVFDLEGRVIGIIQGGGGDEMNHGRVEVIRKQWDQLAAGTTVDVCDDDPLSGITAAFRRVAKDVPEIAVEVLAEGKPPVLGTIVGSRGRILTKSSELRGQLSCRLADGRVFPARIAQVSQEHDLAILSIDAAGLPEARWSQDQGIAPGTPVAALVPGQPPLAGVVSLAARPIPSAAGGLGVTLREDDEGLVVDGLLSRRHAIPLKKGDVVVQIDGKATPNLKAYRELIPAGPQAPRAGDPVRLEVMRGSDPLHLTFLRPPTDWLLELYGWRPSSVRWWGFPEVFDIDAPLRARHCGAPVIDRTGRVVGIVISSLHRFGSKAKCHVIPAHVAMRVVATLQDQPPHDSH